ncbi:hypothetical protein [Megasphaera elsdenii]|uniref:hypothetical protein n=1 Tax=Megasphaera elsdenii TaxID=907 RepID=UPI002432A585|nr:hypothetical protein [Megasphaera elsdenii]
MKFGKFTPWNEWKDQIDGTEHYEFHFKNGYVASVIRGPYSYGGPQGLYELAVLRKRRKYWRENARNYNARKRAGLIHKKKQPPLPEAAPWATEKQRQWQELGRKRVLASRVPYKHCEGLDRDIQEARRRGLSYGLYMAAKAQGGVSHGSH